MEEQLHLLVTVFKCLQQLRSYNQQKHEHFLSETEFCGHVIDAQGLHKATEDSSDCRVTQTCECFSTSFLPGNGKVLSKIPSKSVS